MKKSYRKEGILKPLKRSTMPKHILLYDTETYVIKNEYGKVDFKFRLGVAIYISFRRDMTVKTREVYKFDTQEKFIELCEQLSGNKNVLYVFAHNQGFDLRVLNAFDLFYNRGYESKPPIINNLVFIWGVKDRKKRIDFIDTSNLGIRSVEQLGKDMGYDKLEVDFENVTDEELYTYCLRDVEILEKFVTSYLNYIYDNKLGSFKVTLASQSLASFRTRFMNENIYLHIENGALNLERDAYYGGRTECFKLGYLGQSKWYYLDVNSMYPYVMSKFDLPSEILGYGEDLKLSELGKYINKNYCIADVTIDTKENRYPLRLTNKVTEYNYLHNKDEKDYPKTGSKRLIFPIGRFRTTLHQIELQHAYKNGDIKEIHRMSIYDTNRPFKDYIKFFYDAKNKYGQEGNKTWRLISKLFLNSLYGKFGQLQPNRLHIGEDIEFKYYRIPEYDHSREMFVQRLYWQYDEYLEYKLGETSFSNPALAGAITAYARNVLYDYIKEAGKENCFYCDTDSLIVNEKGYKKLKKYIDAKKIGYLDIEHISRRVIIRGNKDYRLDNVKRHKGISSKAKKTDKNEWEFLHFQGFISWWNNGAIDNMIGEYRKKSRKGEYSKGIVNKDNTIRPYHLKE